MFSSGKYDEMCVVCAGRSQGAENKQTHEHAGGGGQQREAPGGNVESLRQRALDRR